MTPDRDKMLELADGSRALCPAEHLQADGAERGALRRFFGPAKPDRINLWCSRIAIGALVALGVMLAIVEISHG